MFNLANFFQRLIVTVISVLVVLGLLFFADHPFMSLVNCIVIGIIAAIAAIEFFHFAQIKQVDLSRNWIIVITLVQIFSFYVSGYSFAVLPLGIFFLILTALFIMTFRHIEGSIHRLAYYVFALAYIVVPMGMIYSIIYHHIYGAIWAGYLLVVVKVTDIFAYIGGSYLGRNQLAAAVSPKKTWEGAACGLVFAIVASVGYYLIALNFHLGMGLSFLNAVILGLVLGIFAQISDLSESLLKRDVQIKDSSKLAGVGGVLDMIDSLLLTAPLLYVFLKL